MTRIPASQLREALADTLNRVAFQGERVVVERNGKELAALVSIDDLRLLEELEDRMDVKAAKKALKGGKFQAYEELRAALGLK